MLSRDPYNVRAESNSFRLLVAENITSENEVNLLTSVFRHASLYNLVIELNGNLNHKAHIKGVVYDILNSIVAIFNKRERYLQLNTRSLIEHIARIVLNKSYAGNDFDEAVRRRDFDYLKENNSSENWHYMHDVYIKACQFVHFSPQANLNVSSKFLQLLENDCNSSQKSLIKNLHKTSTAIMRIFIKYFHVEIASTFYRTKSDLKFLLGNSLYSDFLSQ
ncbi:hypothetical protein OHJ28_02215 [Dickeya fangzhongdai]|uniref:hypothetical protein n=1 Tax=Dickeya fangzhongdai TaxID=1778540 RepID=UPI003306C407